MVSSIEVKNMIETVDAPHFANQKGTALVTVAPLTNSSNSEDMTITPTRKSSEDISPNRGYTFMVLLSLQYGLQPLIQKSFIDRYAVSKISLVLATEITKIILCSAAIVSSGNFTEIRSTWTLKSSMKSACIPAVCYAFQNWLTQIAYMNLDSLTFILLNQLKTLSAAICLFVVMGSKQSKMQVVALGILLAAAVLLNCRNSQDPKSVPLSWEYGILPVLGASFLSGFSAAVVQKSVQQRGRNSFLLSAELAVYGIIAVLLTTLSSHSGIQMLQEGLWKGWTPWTLIPVFTNGLGGLFVGQVTKHAGSVKKGFALMSGIFVTAVAQYVLEQQPLSLEHYAAAVLVAFSMFLHTKYPYQKKIKSL